MKTKLRNIAKEGLANHWQKYITDSLKKELSHRKNKKIINLASNEYIEAVNTDEVRVINLHFRELRNNKIKNIAINSKKARGIMASFIIEKQITNEIEIQNFNKAKYLYNKNLSDDNNYYF